MRYKINEIFHSIQGEGLMVGTPMNFIRFCKCNLSCEWCDTDFKEGREMEIDEILQKLKRKWVWVSLTGGEPLLEEKLGELVEELHKNNFRIYLETNSTIYDREIMEDSDFISADVKPPSSGNPVWDQRVMDYCFRNPGKSQLKMVIQDHADMEFFRRIYRGDYPHWILQPESGVADELGYVRMLEEIPGNVRIIPQIHKIMEVK
jgi:7-carboxy-7-deazaguanine synthase